MEFIQHLFVMKREESVIFDKNRDSNIEKVKTDVVNSNFTEITFDNRTSIDFFILNFLPFIGCFIKDRDKKERIL